MSDWTDRQIVVIAERIVAQHARGEAVDPFRLEWAEFIVMANRPKPARPVLVLVQSETQS